MRLSLATALVVAVPLLVAPATAQEFALNEIYASHDGTDDMEYVEIVGPAGASLDGFMILVVEGDGNSSLLGGIDTVVDLSGNVMPADGYFVAGNTAVSNLDVDIGASNIIENGTETFYLIQTQDTAAVAALEDTDVTTAPDATTTIIPTLATIIDIIAMVDGGFGSGDVVYDGAATVGPDGNFLPAGIFRSLDFPNPWCSELFLDFDDTVNTDEPRTPGAANSLCAPPISLSADVRVQGTQVSTSFFVGTNNPGDIVVLFGALDTSPGVVLPGIGTVLVDLTTQFILATVPSDADGVATVPASYPATQNPFTLAFQAASVDLATLALDLTVNLTLGHGSDLALPPANPCRGDGYYNDFQDSYSATVTGDPGRTISVCFFDASAGTTTTIQTVTMPGSGAISLAGLVDLQFGDTLDFKCNGTIVLTLKC